jgi:hypothetical protein
MPLVDVPITVTNAQGTDTPAPFQQMIRFNPSLYSPFLLSDLSNIRFTDEDYNALFAWLESYSSTSATVWVRLNDGIRAGQSRTLHMLIGPVGFDGQFWGEAPQLSPTYGQYDSGANVFNAYQNFAGTTLWSGISTISGVTLTQNNGLNVSVSTTITNFYIMTNIYQSSPFIYEVYETYYGVGTGTNGNEQWGLVIDSSTATGQNTGGQPGGTNFLARILNNGGQSPGLLEGRTQLVAGTLNYITQYTAVDSFVQTPTGISATFNGVTISYSTTALTSGYIGVWVYSMVSNFNVATIHWLRVRAYPPNGVMPSVTVGSPKIYNYGYIVYPW